MNEQCEGCEEEFEPTNANQRFCCKTCRQAAHYEANKEAISARAKAHHKANKKEKNARSKAHYEANREKYAAQKRASYERNKEQIAAQKKTYNEVNKEQIAAQKKAYRATPRGRALHLWNDMNYRAGKGSYANTEVRMTKEEWMEWAVPQYATFIEEHPDQTPSVDRIDPDGHYEISNLRIISWRANDFRSRYLSRKMKLSKKNTWDEVCEILTLSDASLCSDTGVPLLYFAAFLTRAAEALEIKKAHPER